MDASYWHQRWETNEIGFHEHSVNPLLVSYFKALSITKGSCVFVPLCGKTLDISWLLANGYHVKGAELSELAIQQLFMELGLQPEITPIGEVRRYSATGIDVFVGNIFDLTSTMLGPVDAVYDRAALVALPEGIRNRYAQHVPDITGSAPQLLITYEYDQRLMDGPPFSIDAEEVKRHYQDIFELSQLARVDVAGGLRRRLAAKEAIWLLSHRTS